MMKDKDMPSYPYKPFSGLIGKKVRLAHWTECHLVVIDVGAKFIFGLVLNHENLPITFDVFSLDLPWKVIGAETLSDQKIEEMLLVPNPN